MTFSFSDFSEALKKGAPISSADVVAARQWVWADGTVSDAEADTIFELNSLARDRSAEWVEFVVEALNEYVVNEQSPRGYVDEAKAAWLIAKIDNDGTVDTRAELELLVKVLETALSAPDSLRSYALRQVETVVTTGQGPTRDGGELRPGSIGEPEVALLRRLLFASGGEGAATVTRDEADMLWRIKDACASGDNAPGWKTLFVQGIANYLMAHNLYHALDRQDAERLEAFISDHHSSVGGFFGRMFGIVPQTPTHDYGELPLSEDIEAAAEQDRALTGVERNWLDQHVHGVGTRDEYEKALLDFIAQESGTRL